MMNLSFEEKSLPQKISEDIIELILEENLQPGDKLPNETILSERLNAGRSSVREAMKLLASRNIVTIRQVPVPTLPLHPEWWKIRWALLLSATNRS